MMKHILLFGAGKSATVLIDYLAQTAASRQWQVSIADADKAAVRTKAGNHPLVQAVELTIENEAGRKQLIRSADVVISLLPPALHTIIAKDCVAIGVHLLTASYIDAEIRAMEREIREKGLLFLCEMGLDPGIDHMSAMQLVHRIKAAGGRILSFLSHCGGLVAPESDSNPWHYKISWNPRNVVLAGKAGAVYREKSKVKSKKYAELFSNCAEVSIDEIGKLASYPNRDSLRYLPIYQLEEAETFLRTTLRHPDFCRGWQKIIELGLTDDKDIQNTDGVSVSGFLQRIFSEKKISFDSLPAIQQDQFLFLGWNDVTLLNKGKCSSADVLQFILEKKWVLDPGDKDMVVMLHEIVYAVKNEKVNVKSSLVVKGDDPVRTAMAKTVGLPLGIAATLLLEGKLTERGLHIPVLPSIYEPVLEKLRDFGISFRETIDRPFLP